MLCNNLVDNRESNSPEGLTTKNSKKANQVWDIFMEVCRQLFFCWWGELRHTNKIQVIVIWILLALSGN
jgi:hypothetical protein